MKTQKVQLFFKNFKLTLLVLIVSVSLTEISRAGSTYFFSEITHKYSNFPVATESGEVIRLQFNKFDDNITTVSSVNVGVRKDIKIEIPAGVSAGYITLLTANKWPGKETMLFSAPARPDDNLTSGKTGKNVLTASVSGSINAPVYAAYSIQNNSGANFYMGELKLAFVVSDVAAYNEWRSARGAGQTPVNDTPDYTTPTYNPPTNNNTSSNTTSSSDYFGCGAEVCTTPADSSTSTSSSSNPFEALFNRSTSTQEEPVEEDNTAELKQNRVEVIQAILMELVSGITENDIVVDGENLIVSLDGGRFIAKLEESNLPETVDDILFSSIKVEDTDDDIITITLLNNNRFSSNRDGVLKLISYSYDSGEISNFLLQEFPDIVENITVTGDGKMIINTIVGDYTATFDYITVSEPDKRSNEISFELMGDLDGDEQDDLMVYYSDGTKQIMYFHAPE